MRKEMEDKKKVAQSDLYCDVCDELITKGTEYYEKEYPNLEDETQSSMIKTCRECEEVGNG